MKYLASISSTLYNSLKINIWIEIMQNRRLKLKQIRKEIFNKRKNFFIAQIEYTRPSLKECMRNSISMNPIALWELASNPIDIKLRAILEQTIENKSANKVVKASTSTKLLGKHYPNGTITDIIEEHMSQNKTSLDESIQMIVDDILVNESCKLKVENINKYNMLL